MMWIYPNVIQPLFNKFETLKDEELKGKIEALAGEHSFPLTNLFHKFICHGNFLSLLRNVPSCLGEFGSQ